MRAPISWLGGDRYVVDTTDRTPEWHDDAACRGMSIADSDRLFFPDNARVTNEAKALCGGCPVRTECAEAGAGEAGVWAA